MNFLKKNWPSAIIFITFSVLVVSLTIHSINQPLEYDEYRAKRLALDAEYSKLFRESTSLIEGMGIGFSSLTTTVEQTNGSNPCCPSRLNLMTRSEEVMYGSQTHQWNTWKNHQTL